MEFTIRGALECSYCGGASVCGAEYGMRVLCKGLCGAEELAAIVLYE